MASEYTPSIDTAITAVPESRNISYSSGITDLGEKKNRDEGDVREGDDLEEEEIKEEEQEELVEASDNFQACLQVVGAFFMMFNSWGICNTYGAYQTYYERGILKDETPSNISWIGSIQAFMLLIVGGCITGPIFDAGYLRALVIVGSFAAVFGMMMTSICQEYWQVVLAQGIVVGFGAGCMLLPSVAVMPQYFTKRKAFATGIGAAGSSLGTSFGAIQNTPANIILGGVIYPIVFHKLEPQIGFGWTTRVIAFIMLATLMIPVTVMRAKVFPSSRRSLVDWKVLQNIPYDLYTIGCFFGFVGMYVPFYYVSSYAISTGVADADLGFYLLTLLNVGSIFGRLIPNFFADTVGPLNITFPFVFFCGLISFCWTSVTTFGQAVMFCLFYGFFSGTVVSISGPAVSSLSPNLALVGTHMGMSFSFTALGLLIGNPLAGALLNGHGYLSTAMFCGTANVLAAILIFAARMTKTGPVLTVKC